MAKKKTSGVTKIRKYRKPLNLNVGMIIFAVIFVYVCICIVMFFRENNIKPYEVREGSLAAENLYNGIIIRDESVVTAATSGYVNYYAREGQRVAVGNLVYTVDETGRLADYIGSADSGENALTDSDLLQLKSEIINFNREFSPQNFSTSYEFKDELTGTVLKYANNTLMQNITQMHSGELSGMVDLSYATNTGILMYWTDGYETLTPDGVTAGVFQNENYEKNQLISNDLVSEGDPVYKICNNEIWSIVIRVDEAKAAELEEEAVVKVRFMKNQQESWGTVTILHNADGNTYAQLEFTNSMISFVNERFLEIELLLYDETGLKIPNSSIVEREFFLIPEEFVTQSGDTSSYGVLREAVLEDGTRSKEYVEVSIYSLVEGEYYVDAGVLGSGDHIYKTDSTESFTISKRATLIGVYNMNKGYADFRQIEILYQNEEYAIVRSNTSYGLNVYDLIVQDASSVVVDQFIYQ